MTDICLACERPATVFEGCGNSHSRRAHHSKSLGGQLLHDGVAEESWVMVRADRRLSALQSNAKPRLTARAWSAGNQARVMLTLMLARVALEYGQFWFAASMSCKAVSDSISGNDTTNRA